MDEYVPISLLEDYGVKPGEVFVAIAIGVSPTEGVTNYTSDPYCVFYTRTENGFKRWHHAFPPTHFLKLPKASR